MLCPYNNCSGVEWRFSVGLSSFLSCGHILDCPTQNELSNVIGFWLDHCGSIPNTDRILFFATTFRPALGPTQPVGVKAESAEIKNAWKFISVCPVRLHDAVLTCKGGVIFYVLSLRKHIRRGLSVRPHVSSQNGLGRGLVLGGSTWKVVGWMYSFTPCRSNKPCTLHTAHIELVGSLKNYHAKCHVIKYQQVYNLRFTTFTGNIFRLNNSLYASCCVVYYNWFRFTHPSTQRNSDYKY
jgi:hypothetical protein